MYILLRLHDMTKIDELKVYGDVVYVSQFTNLVGMKCTSHNLHKIKHLKNVYECESAVTGNLL